MRVIELKRKTKMASWWITLVFISGFLVFHFSLLFINDMPSNYLSIKFGRFINAYVDPIFAQNWTLFAPNPISTNDDILVKYYYIKNGTTHISPWTDISDSLIQQIQRNRISSYSTVEIMFSNAVSSLSNTMASLPSEAIKQRPITTSELKSLEKSPEYQLIKNYSIIYGKSIYPTETGLSIELTRQMPPTFYSYFYRKKTSHSVRKVLLKFSSIQI